MNGKGANWGLLSTMYIAKSLGFDLFFWTEPKPALFIGRGVASFFQATKSIFLSVVDYFSLIRN